MPEKMESEYRAIGPFIRRYDRDQRPYRLPDWSDPAHFYRWQVKARSHLKRRLGPWPPRTSLKPRLISRSKHPGYVHELVDYIGAPGDRIPAHLLLPDAQEARPAVIAVHGHGYGADDVVGIREDGSRRQEPETYHRDFGLALCRLGFVVIAPEMAGFGRRREMAAITDSRSASSCKDLFIWSLMMGSSPLAVRLWDVMRTVDYLATRPEVSPERIGIMGISGGGMVTLFSAALDQRLSAICISGYLNTFRSSVLSIEHCICNYAHGLLADAEMADYAATIAPRWLCVESGIQDPIFPIDATRKTAEILATLYQKLGRDDRFSTEFFDDVHRISGRVAYPFLTQALGLKSGLAPSSHPRSG
ncbi:MAG: acetylxylan esterase [Armatimonadetes bacterium]|nr:acetylxylan esterase [Armatimonadota bacterium]